MRAAKILSGPGLLKGDKLRKDVETSVELILAMRCFMGCFLRKSLTLNLTVV